MLQYSDASMSLTVGLAPGIYAFERESATGKTRLYKYLEQLSASGENVSVYNYTSHRTGAKIVPSNPDLLMVDRLDMFSNDLDFLKQLSTLTNTVVLIDVKWVPRSAPIQLNPRVSISMSERSMEVGYVSLRGQ